MLEGKWEWVELVNINSHMSTNMITPQENWGINTISLDDYIPQVLGKGIYGISNYKRLGSSRHITRLYTKHLVELNILSKMKLKVYNSWTTLFNIFWNWENINNLLFWDKFLSFVKRMCRSVGKVYLGNFPFPQRHFY